MDPSRQASTSGVSIPPNLRWTEDALYLGLAAAAVGAGDVGGPRPPVGPVAGDGDRGLGVPDRVVGGQGRPVATVDLPVAVVVGRAVRVLPAAGFRHGDLGRHERRRLAAAGGRPQGLAAGAAEVAAQLLR